MNLIVKNIKFLFQKFRFVGGLDAPDWVLAEMSEFTKIVRYFLFNLTFDCVQELNIFRNWCQTISNRLKANQKEWKEEELNVLVKECPKIGMFLRNFAKIIIHFYVQFL